MVILLVLLDFSKTFDTVSHDLLLLKLRDHSISLPILSWFQSYLSGRAQRVRGPDSILSSWATVIAGVPQDSVLGPLLFAIFVDLRHSLKHSTHPIC